MPLATGYVCEYKCATLISHQAAPHWHSDVLSSSFGKHTVGNLWNYTLYIDGWALGTFLPFYVGITINSMYKSTNNVGIIKT